MKSSLNLLPISPQILARVDLFTDIHQNDLQKIASKAVLVSLSKNEVFFHQGEPSDRIYLLTEGHVKMIQIHHDGQQIMLRVCLAIEMFGAIALGQVESYPATAIAMDDCQAAYWTRSDLTDLVLQIPQLASNSLRFMAEHLQLMQDRYRLLATEHVEQRLAHHLIELLTAGGKPVDEGIWVGVALSQQELAEMIGTTLYTVSRLLKQWQNNQIVTCKREHIVVRDLPALIAIRGNSKNSQ